MALMDSKLPLGSHYWYMKQSVEHGDTGGVEIGIADHRAGGRRTGPFTVRIDMKYTAGIMRTKTIFFAATLLLTASLASRAADSDSPFAPREMTISSTPECYDSLLCEWHRTGAFSYERFFSDFIIPDSFPATEEVPDSVYVNRLQAMVSPVHLPYNPVIKQYLGMYTSSRRSTVAHILGRSQHYFPMIEQELANAGLPLELRMLPVVESALTPTAVSRAGATGLWQFMYATGKYYGLEITSFIDQRRDPVAATRAACRYLAELHGIYDDWTLALAAYNCGPGNVNKALKRAGAGAKTYWDIYPFLPTETRGYVPSFVAATYAYNYHKLHDINPVQLSMPLSTDTIMVSRLMHLEQVSSTLDTPLDVLRALNPQYKMDIIPAVEKQYSLTLPSTQAIKFIELQETIHAKDTVYLAEYLQTGSDGLAQFNISSITHRVRSGEVLGSIARKYGVTVSQIVKWNNLRSANRLSIGQVLEIYK
jgi:membrane-bound lytic murein transglycosylase D